MKSIAKWSSRIKVQYTTVATQESKRQTVGQLIRKLEKFPKHAFAEYAMHTTVHSDAYGDGDVPGLVVSQYVPTPREERLELVNLILEYRRARAAHKEAKQNIVFLNERSVAWIHRLALCDEILDRIDAMPPDARDECNQEYTIKARHSRYLRKELGKDQAQLARVQGEFSHTVGRAESAQRIVYGRYAKRNEP